MAAGVFRQLDGLDDRPMLVNFGFSAFRCALRLDEPNPGRQRLSHGLQVRLELLKVFHSLQPPVTPFSGVQSSAQSWRHHCLQVAA